MSEQDVFDQLKYRIEVSEYGTRIYYNSAGQLHRENGPAVERANGTKEWAQNGQRHRIDGPAIEWASGRKNWYINDVEMTEAEFNQLVAKMSEIAVFAL